MYFLPKVSFWLSLRFTLFFERSKKFSEFRFFVMLEISFLTEDFKKKNRWELREWYKFNRRSLIPDNNLNWIMLLGIKSILCSKDDLRSSLVKCSERSFSKIIQSDWNLVPDEIFKVDFPWYKVIEKYNKRL